MIAIIKTHEEKYIHFDIIYITKQQQLIMERQLVLFMHQ